MMKNFLMNTPRKSLAQGSGSHRSSDAPLNPHLLELFRELDTDNSGSLSIDELSVALRGNSEFARICGAATSGDRPLSPLAANLIAQNLRKVFDTEFGDADGSVGPSEFCALCARLAPVLCAPQATSAAATTPAVREDSSRSAPAVREDSSRGEKSSRLRFFSSSKPAGPRSPEARLAALQSMLREELIGDLEKLLEGTNRLPDDASKAAAYHRGVCDTLSACRRLLDGSEQASGTATSDGGGGGGAAANGSGAEQEAIELHRLRRDLASTKVALAESESEKEELMKQVRGMEEEKQAALARSRSQPLAVLAGAVPQYDR